MFFDREHTRTAFIRLDTRKCKACWQCIDNCPNQVIGKVDLPFHRHSVIVRPDSCTACMNCISICQNNAFSTNDKSTDKDERKRRGILHTFLINNFLLVSGMVMVFSGMVLQIGFHMGVSHEHQAEVQLLQNHSNQYEQLRAIDTSKIVCGFNYHAWTVIHKFIIVCFSILMIYHISKHWKWYKTVIIKHLIGRNKLVIILSLTFLLVALTGLLPWFIDLSGGTSQIRMVFIEIHDKLTLIFIIILVLHVVQRARWFSAANEKLKK